MIKGLEEKEAWSWSWNEELKFLLEVIYARGRNYFYKIERIILILLELDSIELDIVGI